MASVKNPESEEISKNLQQETLTKKGREFKRFTVKAEEIFYPNIDSASNQCKISKRNKARRCDGNQAKRGRRGSPAKSVNAAPTNQHIPPRSTRSGRDDKVKGPETACPDSSKSDEIMLNLDPDEATDESYRVEAPMNVRLTYPTYFESHRRAVTEKERARAKNSALAVTSIQPNFISVMHKTHVQKCFSLTIPQQLMKAHIPRKAKEAILRVPPSLKTWIVQIIHREYSSGLRLGWADFVMDNNLEEGDACLFELCETQECGRYLINVSIHRVVEETTPLKKLQLPYHIRGKRTRE